jgi:hypothetical protein
MRFRSALLRAMRTWRAGRIGLDEADRLVAGERTGQASPGREQAIVAALAVERRTQPISRLSVSSPL